MKDIKFEKIRNYIIPLKEYWQSGMERVAGKVFPIDDIHESLKKDTLEGYEKLKWDFYEAGLIREGDKLEEYLKEIK